nr:hypothetical protein CFP56_11321 [Quercus suber]
MRPLAQRAAGRWMREAKDVSGRGQVHMVPWAVNDRWNEWTPDTRPTLRERLCEEGSRSKMDAESTDAKSVELLRPMGSCAA